jgi:NAD(P)-dependent dehydrogenase (short-subunit alcohol dehydrogenase family)
MQDRVCLVTGAGSGLGQMLASRLAAEDWRLVLIGRRKERLLETRAMCRAACGGKGDFLALAVDIAEPTAAEHVVTEACGAYGRIDVLVNNAGLARFAEIERADLADLDRMLKINLVAPLALTKQAIPELRRSRGQVVNVGSIGGVLALPGRSFYGATKAALHHVTRSLARELAPDIRVNAVVPGSVDTEMYDGLGLEPAELESFRAGLVATTPMARMAAPEQVVPWIEHLLGPAGEWMTGSLLVVDGGRSC